MRQNAPADVSVWKISRGMPKPAYLSCRPPPELTPNTACSQSLKRKSSGGGTVHSSLVPCCWSWAPSLHNGPYHCQSFFKFFFPIITNLSVYCIVLAESKTIGLNTIILTSILTVNPTYRAQQTFILSKILFLACPLPFWCVFGNFDEANALSHKAVGDCVLLRPMAP